MHAPPFAESPWLHCDLIVLALAALATLAEPGAPPVHRIALAAAALVAVVSLASRRTPAGVVDIAEAKPHPVEEV